ncbi:hypothetical protein [Gallibacterium anatis]
MHSEIHEEMTKVAKQLGDNPFIAKQLISYENNTIIVFFEDEDNEDETI